MTRRRRLLLLAAAALLTAAVTVGVLLGTRWGLVRTVALADKLTPVSLSARVENGSVLGGFTLSDVTLIAAGSTVELDRLSVAWRPLRLLRGELSFARLEAGALRVQPAAPDSSTEAPSDHQPGLDLPLGIVLDELRVGSVQIGSEADPVVRDLVLVARVIDGHLQLDRLELVALERTISAHGSLVLAPPWAHSLDASIADELATVVATVRGDGGETNAELRADTLGARVDARLEDALGSPSWTARATVANQALSPDLGPLELQAAGTMASATASGSTSLSGRRLRVPALEVALTPDGIRIPTLRITAPDDGARFDATATLDRAGELRLEGRLAAQAPTAVDLALTLAGRPDAWRATLAGTLADADAEASLTGDTRQAELTSLTLGALSLDGSLAWQPALSWRVSGRAEQLETGSVLPELPGTLSFAIEGAGSGTGYDLAIDDLTGTLRDRPVAGALELRGTGMAVEHLAATLDSGTASVRATGRWEGDFPVGEFHVDAPALADLVPGATGQVTLHGIATGTGIELRGDARELVVGDLAVARADLAGTIDPAPPRAQLSLVASGATIAATPVEHLELELEGWLEDALASFHVIAPSLGAARGQAGYRSEEEARELIVQSLELTSEALGAWALEGPLRAAYRRGNLAIERRCLAGARGRLCLAAQLAEGQAGSAAAELTAFPLSLAEPAVSALLDEPLRLTGELTGRLDLETSGLSWNRIDAELSGNAITVAAPARVAEEQLELDNLTTRLTGDASALELVLATDGPVGELTVGATLDDPLTGLRALRAGSIRLTLADLGAFRPLAPDLPGLGGTASAEVDLDGDPLAPNVRGRLNVSGLAFQVPRQGVRVTDGTLSADVDRDGAISLDGRLPIDGGVLTLTGSGTWSGGGPPAFSLAIDGDALRLADSPELRLVASPDVDLQVGANQLVLRGTVAIDEAQVRTRTAGTVIRPSSDVVLAGEESDRRRGIEDEVDVQLRVALSDEVRFEGFGLEAALSGTLDIIDRPGAPTLADGEIQVSGRYEAWGQKLTIESGRLIFAGTPITDPALSLEAVRVVDGVRVGVRVTGAASDPTVEVFSTPAMDSSRALALLLLGRPLEDTSRGESDVLANAALALAIRRGGKLSGAIGEELGLAEFDLSVREDLGGAALSIGRQLSSRLYLGYSIGLAEAIDLITLRYRISDHWSLETQIGDETRGALRYEIERGRPTDTTR